MGRTSELIDEAERVAQSQGIDAVPADPRALLVLYTAEGIYGNGGVQYFFEGFGRADAVRVVEAAERVGLTAWVAPWRRLAEIVPDTDDVDERLAALEAHADEVARLERDLDLDFGELDRYLDAFVAARGL